MLHAMNDQQHDDLLLIQFYNKVFLLWLLLYYPPWLLRKLILVDWLLNHQNKIRISIDYQMMTEEIMMIDYQVHELLPESKFD
jgi:hypothetical protein